MFTNNSGSITFLSSSLTASSDNGIYVVDVIEKEEAKEGESDGENAEAKKYDVNIEMTLTSPMCPAGPQLVGQSKQVVSAIEGVDEVDVKVVMDPPWTPDCMTEDARDKLNMF